MSLLALIIPVLVIGLLWGALALLAGRSGAAPVARLQLLGICVGAAAAAAMVATTQRAALGAAPVAASCWLIGLVMEQRALERQGRATQLRVASLLPRRLNDVLSPTAVTVARVLCAVTLGLMTFSWATATEDIDAGTSLTFTCLNGGSARGPYAGGTIAITGILAVMALWALMEFALRECVRRGGPDTGRSVAARTAVTATAIGVLPTLAVWMFTTGMSLKQTCAPLNLQRLGTVLLLLAAATALISLAAWVATLVSAGRATVRAGTPV